MIAYVLSILGLGCLLMTLPIVLDTNVIVAALQRGGTSVRQILRGALDGHYRPLMAAALYSEYVDVCSRASLFASSVLSSSERFEVLDAVFKVSHWVQIYYLWRPNLPDEGDNHVVELALAGGAAAIVTRNLRDFERGELRFPTLQVLSPERFLEKFPCPR
jgi:predicted nucleic acid-binding protein